MRDQTSIFMIIDNTDCACACQLDQVAGEKDRFCAFARTGATGWCGYCLQETGSEYNRASPGGAASERFPNRRVGGLTVELEKWRLLSASSTHLRLAGANRTLHNCWEQPINETVFGDV